MQAACKDNSVTVNQYGVGNTAYGIQLGAFAVPVFQVGHLRPRDVQLLDGFFPCGLHGDELQEKIAEAVK